jgi:hypothetical protein
MSAASISVSKSVGDLILVIDGRLCRDMPTLYQKRLSLNWGLPPSEKPSKSIQIIPQCNVDCFGA